MSPSRKQDTKVLDSIREAGIACGVSCMYSAIGHFAAASRWRVVHYCIGIPNAVCAALSGGLAFGEAILPAGVFAALATGLAVVLTFLDPNSKASAHHSAGVAFTALRDKVSYFCRTDLDNPRVPLGFRL